MSLFKLAKFASWVLLGVSVTARGQQASTPPLRVGVAIAPIAWILDALGDQNALTTVTVLGPNQHPHTFAPSPTQVMEWAKTDIYFAIGLPFEAQYLPKLRSQNPKLKIVPLAPNALSNHHHDHNHDHGEDDPHLWLDPVWMVSAVGRITQVLASSLPPQQRADLGKRSALLRKQLGELDAKLKTMFSDSRNARFWVHHAAFNHFAKRYGLEQVAIESHGKEPSPKFLHEVLQRGRAANVKIIFTQRGLQTSQSEFVAKELGAKVIELDPLSGSYSTNIIKMAEEIKKGLVPPL